ncbi:unnamed protein product [Brachionus calyciflorus]|uniref:Dihydrolipoyllysine-residue succinyltransferase component of 2-oxoglutarate dehydrogenase complex, mitochondrial n=1 Tax=Brachionus calyciflorus TaxID=104777 RepID=A0A813N4W4_9BILA|nr:unnamed protein product [Brachionus calyciflorus]
MSSRLVLNSLKKSSNLSRVLLNNSNKIGFVQTNNLIKNSFSSKALKSNNHVLIQTQRASIHLSQAFLNEVITVESPVFAESISEGNFVYVKKVGDSVQAGEIIANIETDKTILELKAPQSGVIEGFFVEDNTPIKGKSPAVKLRLGGGAQAAATPAPASTPKPAEEKKVEEKAPSHVPTKMPEVPQVPKKPLASVPISQIPVTPLVSTPSQAVDIKKISGTRAETKVKMNKMRQTIANRLKTAQNTCAMLTTFNEINMGNLVDLRKTYGDQFHKRHNLKLGFMSAFVKASAAALMDQPVVNAVIENNEIVYRDYVDISVAVATPKGLVVPVLRNVEKMSYADIEKEIAALGEKAKTNNLAIEDMQGGTFTISNGGVFGSLFGTPIINLPQSAILGMHGIFDRPVAINGQVVIRPMMYVALTYDHRLIDGREAVTFLRKIKSAVEDPRTLLLDI